MKREQAAFLGAGVLFGFVVGFVVAWGINNSPETPPMPEARAPRGGSMAAPSGTPPQGSGAPMDAQIGALRQRIEENPGDSHALVELALLYMQVSMFPQAQQYLEQAVQANPGDDHAHLHLGVALGQQGDLEGARREFETVIEMDPEGWRGWFYLGVTAARQQDMARAREAVAKVESLNPGLPELGELKQQLGG